MSSSKTKAEEKESDGKSNGVAAMEEETASEEPSKEKTDPEAQETAQSEEKAAPEPTADESTKCEGEGDDNATAETPKDAEKTPPKREEETETKEDATMKDAVPPKMEESGTSEIKRPQDHNVGRVFERTKMLPQGQLYPFQGTVVEFREQEGRIPPRWSVHWPTAENIIQEEEWIAADLSVTETNDSSSKAVLDTIQARYQRNLEQELESSNLVSTLLIYAAIEEALQASLHQKEEPSTTANKGESQPHPPLYYSSNPSSYLQPPTATDTAPSYRSNQVQMTPANLAQRVRSGCSWAWSYLESQQPPPTLPLLPNARRSLRQPKALTAPTVPEPVPVKRGGRVAMYWLHELRRLMQEQEDANTKKVAKLTARTASDIQKDGKDTPKKSTSRKEVDETEDVPVEEDVDDEDSEESPEAKNDDEDFKEEDTAEDDDEEELEGVEKERSGNLDPVPEPTQSEDEEEEEEDDDDENDIIDENPFLKPSLPAFLEHLARPKTLTGQDIQTAFCDTILRIKHNKRSSAHGLPVSSLVSVDHVVLDQETPNYPPGIVVLNCMSGETFAELKNLDANVFSRCRFSLDVIGEQEKSQQVKRQQELQKQETEFKERKAWDRWRHKGIHEGFTTWPSWNEAMATWVKENVAASNEASAEESASKPEAEGKDDEALARSLEEDNEPTTGRRRPTRRAASSGGDGVFYGNQSQLTQKQLGDALIRLVKGNGYQTMIGLQGLVADDSNDPIRRSRVSLGRLVWKRNQLARKSVTCDLSDDSIAKQLSGKPLLTYLKEEVVAENGETEEKEPPEEATQLVAYVKSLHATELQLRKLVLKHLAEIPISIVATAADERPGSMESMDSADFEDPTSIEWYSSCHDFIGEKIYRPAESTAVTDMTACRWYKIQDYSKSVESDSDEGAEEGPTVERRMRFRAVPCAAPGESTFDDGDTLILTESQVSAGMKALILEQQQNSSSKSSRGNPFARGAGDRISLIPVDMDETDDGAKEIQGRIVGHDNVVEEDDDEDIEYRILVLPDSGSSENPEAFWATLDVRADDASYMCQPVGESTTWYSIEHFDYHQTSAAFKECQNIINWLKRQSKAGPFMEPVDPVALNIPSYPEVVKNPMDISTLEDKLENGHYSSIPPGQSAGYTPVSRMLNGPFVKDVKLMFDNAMLFNPPDDWIYQASAHLKKSALKKIADASHSANQKLSGAGRAHQKRSVYVDDDSDVDMYEYESDQDEDFETGRRRIRKRKRASRGGGNKDDAAARAIEHFIRLQATLREDLRGPFANLPINSDASSFTLPCKEWSCRLATDAPSPGEESETAEKLEVKKRAREMAELLSLQKAAEEDEASHLRRSTRAHHTAGSGGGSSKSRTSDIEFFSKRVASALVTSESPASRFEVEVQHEKQHDELYAKLYQEYSSMLVSAEEGSSIGLYSVGAFPPYLGRVVPVTGKSELSWEVRTAFLIPALRWVLRGLIQSDHLTTIEPMSTDMTSGVVLTNDAYYFDAKMTPFEVLNLKELQRRKRANKSDDEESEEDIELSEYEKLRAERVARNAERLKALGLA
jgi:hypothetical protein